MIQSTKDFWSGLIYIAFGLSAIVIARDYDMGTALRMGPAYFPTILGALLMLIGAISVMRSFFVRDAPIGGFALKAVLIVVVATFLFGVTVRGAGLAIALPILIIVSATASNRFTWLGSVALAAGLTIFCVLVFLKGLGVPLPIIGPWFAE
jgi:Tripartite tricarboxylate transporter TctB family